MQLKGSAKLQARLESIKHKYGDAQSARVGYTMEYALRVHEDRKAKHRVGRAGYLLDVLRENADTYKGIVQQMLRSGATLGQACYFACLQLQRDSQQNCPVLTSALRNSAFTELS
jgi:hypothetical protein